MTASYAMKEFDLGRFISRVFLFAIGAVVALALLAAMAVLLAMWGLRYAWARITGRPVQPWIMRFDPRAGFGRFGERAGGLGGFGGFGSAPKPADEKEESPLYRAPEITDAEIKEPRRQD